MRLPLWGCLYALLLSLFMVTGIRGVTISITSGIATSVVGPVVTVLQSATVIAIPGLSSTITNVASPTPVLPPDPSEVFNTIPVTTLISTGTHVVTDSLTQITVTTSTSSTIPPLSSLVPAIGASSGGTSTSIPSTLQTSSRTSSTQVPIADDIPTITSEPISNHSASAGKLGGGIAGGAAAFALLIGLICYFFRKNRSKKTNRRKRKKGKKTLSGLVSSSPNGNNPRTPPAVMSGAGAGSDLENGIQMDDRSPSAASNSIAETPSEYYSRSPAPNSTRPGNSRPTSPLSTVGTVSTFAPTFSGSNMNETLWPQTPATKTAFAARNNANASPKTPIRPRRSDPAERLRKEMAQRTPPTNLPHIRIEKSPIGTPARRIQHPGGQKLPDRPESTQDSSFGSIEGSMKPVKPAGAHYIGISSPNINYGVMNPYENDAGEGPAPKEDSNGVTQFPGRISRRNLSPEPLKIVKRTPSQPGNAPKTPTRSQKRVPAEMKDDSDESDEETRSKLRNKALKALIGDTSILTTDKALRKSRISVHSPPPKPVKKGKAFGLDVTRRSSDGNLSPLKAVATSRPPPAVTRSSSVYSRNSAGISPPDVPDSSVFEDYKHDHGRKGKAHSTELDLDDGVFRGHYYNKRDL